MKQNNMFMKNLLKFASWTMAHASWMTMALSPVAMGKAAEKNSVEYYKSQVRAMGLDKGVTISEFFEKIKADLPGNAYYEFEQAVKHNPNAVMPKFEVKSAKASDGQVIPVITFTENGKTSTIQMYGEKDKFMKYNNVVVSENDSQNPATLFQKLIDNDSKLNQKYQDGLKKERQVSSKTTAVTSKAKVITNKFTAMNKDLWKRMTAEQRVSYIIYTRQLYLDAQKVLQVEEQKGKKTSSLDVFQLMFKYMVRDALAGGPTVGMGCVVAGYISSYVRGNDGRIFCSIDTALKDPKYNPGGTLPIVAEINSKCSSGTVACNPFVYSFDDKGAPHCINRNSAGVFRDATHWKSDLGNTCDSMSRLTNYQVKDTVRKNEKGYVELSDVDAAKKYDENGNLDENGKSNLELTKAFIKNFLKGDKKKEGLSQCLLAEPPVMTPSCVTMIGDITEIGNNFKDDIKKAIDICKANEDKKVIGYSKDQLGACDQIRKRWLSFDALIATIVCEDGSKPVDGKCPAKPTVVVSGDQNLSCPEGSKSVDGKPEYCTCETGKVSFRAGDPLPKECKPQVCTPDDDKPCPEPEEPEGQCSQYPPLKVGDKLNSDCTCKNKEGANGNIPKEDQPGFFDKLFNTKKNKQFKKPSTEDGTRKAKKSTNNDQQREYSCKFGPNWWLVAGGALAVGGVIALAVFAAKKKTVTKTVTETKTVDNTVTCAPPKYAMLVTENAPGSPTDAPVNRSFYKCVCPQSQRVCQMANGSTITVQANPITCDLPLCPTEGGTGTAPTTDSGGVPSQN